jgi:carboxyl-terminal processing protease
VPDAAFEPVCAAIAERASQATITDLAEGAVEGIFRYGLDPFSGYVPADLAARLAAHDAGRFDTIGVVAAALEGGVSEGTPCTPISDRCRYLILTVLPATPAEEAGLSRGDAITAVDGVELEGRSPAEVHALMEGDAGSEITLRLQRESRQLEVTLLRRVIELVPVEWEAAGDILYVRLADFSQLGAQLLGRVLQTPEAQSAGALILDLRDNPGGLVLSAVAVTSQFIGEGVAMRVSDGSLEEGVPVIEGGLATRPELAVVVLVNRSSASAAEVVAAALQEAGRATVVGERTYGKDRVQQVYPVRGGAELWVTVARWTTAGGSSIGIYGVQPDVVVADQRTADHDHILERALTLVAP